jgi:hypothetical protein
MIFRQLLKLKIHLRISNRLIKQYCHLLFAFVLDLHFDHDGPGVSNIGTKDLISINQGAGAGASTVPTILDHFVDF